jgi:putative iron-dependent peroxidase
LAWSRRAASTNRTARRMREWAVTPRPGIFSLGAESHLYLEFDILTADRSDTFVSHLARLLARPLGPLDALVATSAVVGVRPELWASVAGDRGPREARSFQQVGEGEAAMPATQHDAWVWLAAARRDPTYDAGRVVLRALEPVSVLETEAIGWSYHAQRDLTGCVDETENPSVLDAPSVAVGLTGPGAGSGVVLVPQSEHRGSFAELPVAEQERVFDRTKIDDEELTDDAMPPDALVARTAVGEGIEGGGRRELKIYRRTTAWGGLRRHGAMFVGFAGTPHPLQCMRESMAGVIDGVREALTLHATPLTGSSYVVPALETLAGMVG